MATSHRNDRSTNSIASNDCDRGQRHKSKNSCHMGTGCKAIEEEEGEGEDPPTSSKDSTAHAMEQLGDLVANLAGEHTGLSVPEKVMPLQEQADQANSVASHLSAPSRPTN